MPRELRTTTEQRMSIALDAMPTAVVVFDPDQRVVICNAAYRSHYHPFEDLIVPGITLEELLWLRVNKKLDQLAVEGGADFVAAQLRDHVSGPELDEWQDARGRHLRRLRTQLPDGCTLGMRIDITDLREAERDLVAQTRKLEAVQRNLQALAMTDDLTGLTNRRAAEVRIEQMLEQAEVSDRSVTILAADLDGFKQINDRFGHPAGDAVLRTAAHRLQGLVACGDLIARMGGDEFILALDLPPGSSRATELARNVITAIAKPVLYEGHRCKLGVSLGIATQVDSTETPDTLLSRADLALYQAKRSGRNRFVTYDKTFQRKAEMNSRLSVDLLSAIERDELAVYLQPIVNASDQRITGSEALVRWHHPELGVLAPGQFLHIADEMKMSREIDGHVLKKTVEISRDWDAEIPFPSISINLSQVTLQDRGFIDDVIAADITEGTISFEILETVYSDAPDEEMRWTLDELRERGFEIAVDDFGTGRSSINSVIQLQPDRLKIDRSFTQDIVESERAREIVHLTVALSQTLGASVTAEGVETIEQAMLLKKLGCDKLQGYLFGKPMPKDLFFAHLLEEQRQGRQNASGAPQI